MAKQTIWVAHLEAPDGTKQRMTFAADDKDSAKTFAEEEARREADKGVRQEGVVDAVEARNLANERVFKVKKVEPQD